MSDINIPETVMIPIADLKPHPRNYRRHPPDQLEELRIRLRQLGAYKNVVATEGDHVLLAGHGIIEAAQLEGMEEFPAKLVPFHHESPQALKILAGDNAADWLAEDDDRLWADLFMEIKDSDLGLAGSGITDEALTMFLFTTRTSDEIPDVDVAAEYVGMPKWEVGTDPYSIRLDFDTPEEREECLEALSDLIKIIVRKEYLVLARYPAKGGDRDDNRNVIWDG